MNITEEWKIDDQYNQMYEFVKAIELAHGIKD